VAGFEHFRNVDTPVTLQVVAKYMQTNAKCTAGKLLAAGTSYLVPALWSVGTTKLCHVEKEILDHLDALDGKIHLGMELKTRTPVRSRKTAYLS
jgi:hypothetical protein